MSRTVIVTIAGLIALLTYGPFSPIVALSNASHGATPVRQSLLDEEEERSHTTRSSDTLYVATKDTALSHGSISIGWGGSSFDGGTMTRAISIEGGRGHLLVGFRILDAYEWIPDDDTIDLLIWRIQVDFPEPRTATDLSLLVGYRHRVGHFSFAVAAGLGRVWIDLIEWKRSWEGSWTTSLPLSARVYMKGTSWLGLSVRADASINEIHPFYSGSIGLWCGIL